MLEYIHITEPTSALISLSRLKKDNRHKHYYTIKRKDFENTPKYIDSNGEIYIEKSFLADNRKSANPVRGTKEKAREYNRIKQQEHRKKIKTYNTAKH